YREDLSALVELLGRSSDPQTEEKIMQVLNSEQTPRAGVELLEGFLKNTNTLGHKDTKRAAEPWASLDRLYAANKKYLASAKLFDAGRKTEAKHRLDELLKEHPQYPFAVMLRRLI